jgi:hypothetical protein
MRNHLALALLLSLTIACGKDTDDTSSTDDTGPDTSDPMDQYIALTEELVGDIACYEPGTDWLSQTVDEAKVADRSLEGLIEDFEDEIGVNEVDLEIWLSDSFSGAADISAQSNSAGDVTVEVPTCAAMAYKTSTPPGEERTVDTYEAHQIYGYVDEGGTLEDNFNSVSAATYVLIPSLLGVSMDDDKSVIAGTAYGCDGQPLENAQIVVVDDDGNIPESLVTNYFVDSWPVRDQPHTSEDGLWVAMNVPEGGWTIELYGLVGGETVLLGATRLVTFAGGINISNIYTGYGDGVYYPESCLAE